MKIIFILLILTSPSILFCQITFEKEIGGRLPDYGKSAIETPDNGFILIGESYSFTNGSKDIYIIKTDKKGDKIWDKNYGGINSDYAYDIKRTTDGNYVIIGATDNFGKNGTPNVYLLKINSLGDTLWTKTYGTGYGDYGYSIIESHDECLVMTGMTYEYPKGKKTLLVIKTDKFGNELWLKRYEIEESYIGKSIILTNDSSYIILTHKPEYGGQIIDSHLKVFKISFEGDILWSKIIKNKYSFRAGNIIRTHDNGYLICGTSVGDSLNKKGATDIYLVKINLHGEVKWMQNFGQKDYDFGHYVTQTSDSNYVIVGETYRHENYNNYKDLILYKVDSLGITIWSRTYKSKGIKLGSSISETSDIGFIISGTLNNNDGLKEDEMFLLKVDKEGVVYE